MEGMAALVRRTDAGAWLAPNPNVVFESILLGRLQGQLAHRGDKGPCGPFSFQSLRTLESLATLPLRACFILLRKEVIQPHLPIRLPCYDLAPIRDLALGAGLRCRLP